MNSIIIARFLFTKRRIKTIKNIYIYFTKEYYYNTYIMKKIIMKTIKDIYIYIYKKIYIIIYIYYSKMNNKNY